jgi:hypothetical protein
MSRSTTNSLAAILILSLFALVGAGWRSSTAQDKVENTHWYLRIERADTSNKSNIEVWIVKKDHITGLRYIYPKEEPDNIRQGTIFFSGGPSSGILIQNEQMLKAVVEMIGK